MPTERRGSRAERKLVPVVAALAAALALCVVILVGGERAEAAPPRGEAPECAPGVDLLGFSDALDKRTFRGTTVGGLSDLAYTGRRGVYYSIVDNGPDADSPARFYTLSVPVRRGGLGEPEVLAMTVLRDGDGEPFNAANFDGEGLALTRRGDLLVSSETEPSIRRFSTRGRLLEELPVPRRFRVAPAGGGRDNQTFESLALSPNDRSLFAANEGFLIPDGETADGSDRIRILRYEDRGPGGFRPTEEFYYLVDPNLGVVELVALSEDELLVLERGFRSGFGNTVRVYKISLKRAEDVSDEPGLAATDAEPLGKELLVDLGTCPEGGAESPGTQQNELLDNFESLELGPRLPGGRRSLVLVSDDNSNDVQVTRVVALGVENGLLR